MTVSALTRSWPTLAAWGAGLVQLGVGAGLVTRSTDATARGVGGVLTALGVAALAWGIISLARGRVIAPRAGIALALIGTLAAVAALSVAPDRVTLHATGVTVVLWLVLGVATAAVARRRTRGAHPTASPDPGGARAVNVRTVPRTSVVGILVGAVLVAGLVTPALGATEAGGLAPDHSDHPLFVDHGH